jgi:hypothetical protein
MAMQMPEKCGRGGAGQAIPLHLFELCARLDARAFATGLLPLETEPGGTAWLRLHFPEGNPR